MNTLVRLFGFPGTLLHGDPLFLDRWRWLKKHLPPRDDHPTLLDIGCGVGAFSIAAALRGYHALGLSWDERNQNVAAERAKLCKAPLARFAVQDVRFLDQCAGLQGQFDVVVCCENIEHILDDKKLAKDMAACLKPGGTLLLTTPNINFKPMHGDDAPLSKVEDGGHVRRGYSQSMLHELCDTAGLQVKEIGCCGSFFSQKLTSLCRRLCRINKAFGCAFILPLRILPVLFEPFITKILKWPEYSITLVATKTTIKPGIV